MRLPAAGQGANSALESCKVLGSVLAEAGGDVSQVPQRFTSARLADMHALNELDAKAYSFFRCADSGTQLHPLWVCSCNLGQSLVLCISNNTGFTQQHR
jgi:2-polyprenyl-6-methoxyphenol hydroxylase-like FAD-dependent oxidoreductase